MGAPAGNDSPASLHLDAHGDGATPGSGQIDGMWELPANGLG